MSITEEPRKISRRGLLKAGGALVVMSAAVPAALQASIAEAAAAGLPFPTPDRTELSTWLTVHANGRITWRTGHVELGQGNRTALAQMVAEELDVAFDKVTPPSAPFTMPSSAMERRVTTAYSFSNTWLLLRVMRALTAVGSGCSSWRRANASRRLVRSAPRMAARWAV